MNVPVYFHIVVQKIKNDVKKCLMDVSAKNEPKLFLSVADKTL
jgi:hypothetical protein